MERGQIVLPGTVRLGRVVIPSSNTPVKGAGSILVPKATWKYKGPACIITLTYQVGYWGLTFNGMTAIVSELLEQPASATLTEFTSPAGLKGVNLTGLSGAADSRYDMEMWFKRPSFADQGAIFIDCCEIAVVPPPTVYTCPICGATFATQAELNAHILAQHPTAPAGEYTLTLVAMPDFTKGWITVYPDKPSYNKWDIVTLTAHGIAVYDFSYWQIDDSEPTMLNPMAMYVTANHVIRAYFV